MKPLFFADIAATRFGIRRVILVGDRGMFNAAVILRIEELGLQYIAGVKMRQDWDVREIVLEDKTPFETVAENLKVKMVELGGTRYIICVNYKGLWQLERAFREIKNTFEIRPIWLSREDRICGHIAVCFLAFCLQSPSFASCAGKKNLPPSRLPP